MAESAERVGEVIEASTTDFVAQCYELYRSPPLGSLVKTRDLPVELYGIVYNATTTGLEPGRRPIARGKDEAIEEAKKFSLDSDEIKRFFEQRLKSATQAKKKRGKNENE